MNPFTELRLKNLRCFEDETLRLDPRLTVVIGENGAGKTTLAEAFASLSHGDDEGLAEFPLRHGCTEGKIALYDASVTEPAAEWSVEPSGERRRRLPSERYLLAYGRYRRVHFPEPTAKPGMPEILGPEWTEDALRARPFSDLETAAFRRRTTTLTRPDNHLLRDLGGYLVELDKQRSGDPRAERTWQRLEESLLDLGQGLEGIAVTDRQGRRQPVLRRSGVDLSLYELSDGYQSLLVVLFDLALRYLYFFLMRPDPLSGSGFVVVDEVDLHLHPRWQRLVTGQLARLFPGTQLVVTTHSPGVVQGAIDEGFGVVVLKERSGRVAVEELDDETRNELQGAEIGSLWTERRLFDVPSRYSPRVEVIEDEVRELRKKLETGEATPEDRKRILVHLEKLEDLEASDEERRATGPLLSELAKTQIALLRQLEEKLGGGEG